MDDALAALHTVGEDDEEVLANEENGEMIDESEEQLVAAEPTALGQPSIVMASGASSLGQPSTLQQPPPVQDPSVVQQQLVPAQQAPSVAQQLLADFAAAKAKAKTRSAKAKPSAKAPPKSKAKAKAKAEPAQRIGRAEAKAKAVVDAAARPKRKLNHEAKRKIWRCRFPDGTSKGFRYEGDEDKEAKRWEAQARLDAWAAEV